MDITKTKNSDDCNSLTDMADYVPVLETDILENVHGRVNGVTRTV